MTIFFTFQYFFAIFQSTLFSSSSFYVLLTLTLNMCLIKLFSLWLFRSTGQCCLLLKHKANHHLPNHQGQTALDIAVHNSDADIVTLLRLAALNEEIRENDLAGDDDTFNQVVTEFSQMVYTHPERLHKKSDTADHQRKN